MNDMDIIAETKGKAAVIKLSGDLDYDNYKELEVAIEYAMAKGNTPIAIEISGVPHIDSMGLGTLTKYWRLAQQQEQELCLVGPQKAVESMINLVNLDKRIKVYASVDEAMQ